MTQMQNTERKTRVNRNTVQAQEPVALLCPVCNMPMQRLDVIETVAGVEVDRDEVFMCPLGSPVFLPSAQDTPAGYSTFSLQMPQGSPHSKPMPLVTRADVGAMWREQGWTIPTGGRVKGSKNKPKVAA